MAGHQRERNTTKIDLLQVSGEMLPVVVNHIIISQKRKTHLQWVILWSPRGINGSSDNANSVSYRNSLLLAGLPQCAIHPFIWSRTQMHGFVLNLDMFSQIKPLPCSLQLPGAALVRYKTQMLGYKSKNRPFPTYLKALFKHRVHSKMVRSYPPDATRMNIPRVCQNRHRFTKTTNFKILSLFISLTVLYSDLFDLAWKYVFDRGYKAVLEITRPITINYRLYLYCVKMPAFVTNHEAYTWKEMFSEACRAVSSAGHTESTNWLLLYHSSLINKILPWNKHETHNDIAPYVHAQYMQCLCEKHNLTYRPGYVVMTHLAMVTKMSLQACYCTTLHIF